MKNTTLIMLALTSLLSTQCRGAASADEDNRYIPLDLSTKSSEFVQKGHSFAFEFIDRINDTEKKDYVISPLSMQFLLGMILDGAQGTTADEICRVLGYGSGEVDAVNEYCLAMLEQLPKLDKKTRLDIANAIFVSEGVPLLDSYEKTVADKFRAAVSNLDFNNGEKALKVINGWCSDHTNGMIPKILDEVDPDMLAYLLNAMYFKSEWTDRFSKSATADEPFTVESGQKRPVKMMKQEREFEYGENSHFRWVVLPYGNRAFQMNVLMPTEGHTLAEMTEILKTESWDRIRHNTYPCEVDLWLPKFESRYHIKLNDILSEMGMPSAFDPHKADFKAMSKYAFFLDFVQQDAVIKVDEEGAEAAVISSAGIKLTTAIAPGPHIVFHADHPFLYLITESSTGAVLFAGRYSGQ
ncbi:MAG: serpin family protein [Bacteroidales bacterium]|nr:serpin family protein [Bacteroidales bacterium]